MSHAFRVFAVLSLAVTGCTQAPSQTPGLQADAQPATATNDWESWTAVGTADGATVKARHE